MQFTFVRRVGDLAGALVFMTAANGVGAVGSSVFHKANWGTRPMFAVVAAAVSGIGNTAASLLTQRAQLRGADPGTATSIAALYPAVLTCLSVLAGFERFSPLKICGLLLAIGSGVCFARSK